MTDRTARRLLLIVILGLLMAVGSTDLPQAAKGHFWSDGATYYAMAWSLARDGDLRYEERDVQRVRSEFPAGPEGIFLKRASGGVTLTLRGGFPWFRRVGHDESRLYFAKSFAYPLAAAPFVRLLGTRGLLLTNGLFLGLALWLGFEELVRGCGPGRALALSIVLILATIVPVYLLWPHPEVFNLGVVMASLAAWRRGRTGWAGVLLGIATYSKPANLILAIPLCLDPLLGRGEGPLWPGIRTSLGRVSTVIAVSAVLFTANAAATGEWNYQGGERKTFGHFQEAGPTGSGEYPLETSRATFDSGGDWMSTDHPSANQRDARELGRTFAANLAYFWVGRYAGALPYFFPVTLAAVVFLVAGPRDRHGALALAALFTSAAVYLLLIPDNWYGGGGALGNRYFVNLLPLAFVFVPRGREVFVAAAGLLGGALFLGPIWLSPLHHSIRPGDHALALPYRTLPLELTMLDDLSFCTEPWRKSAAFGGGMADGLGSEDSFWLYFPDNGTFGREEFEGSEGFWLRAGESAEVVLRVRGPVRTLRAGFRGGSLADEIRMGVNGRYRTLALGAGEARELVLDPGKGFPYYGDRLYVLRLRSRTRSEDSDDASAAFIQLDPSAPATTKTLLYDLARRTVAAQRWSARDVLLFGTAEAEPQAVEGFYAEAQMPGQDSFRWAARQAAVSFDWPQAIPRGVLLDIAPFGGIKAQRVEVRINGKPVERLTLQDGRARYDFALPANLQRPGTNLLGFVFERTMSPREVSAESQDHRSLAAAFYSLVVGSEGDATLKDLQSLDAPQPFSVLDGPHGRPALVEIGPSAVRYAVRLPPEGELRFTPSMHPAARAAGAAAAMRVTLEGRDGQERELWRRSLSSADGAPREVVLALPGEAGTIVRIGLHVDGAVGDRFAWAVWGAPRILGKGSAYGLKAAPFSAEDDRAAQGLRQALAGSNVLLVILDAARARQFGCYGYGRATTPEIDRMAREGVVFENAFTPAVYTLGAMASVWTSQYPDLHHDRVSFLASLPKDRVTLAEVLSKAGMRTGGFVANAVAGPGFGLDRGFTDFQETFRQFGSAAGAFRIVVPTWLRANREQRVFAYLHFREPHFPYDPPAPFDVRFGPDGPLAKAVRSDERWIDDVNQRRTALHPQELDHLIRLYDGNLAFADQEFGALRRALEAEGLWNRTVLIVTADHGEGLFEHGWIGHGVQVYEENIRIPLIVRFPSGRGPAGLRVTGLTDLLDIAPTIADIFGVTAKEASGHGFEGRSLLPVVAGAPGKPVVLSRTVWERPVYGFRDERYKLIYDSRTGMKQLFDLAVDPEEERDIHATEPLRAAFYLEELQLWLASRSPDGKVKRPGPVR